MTLVDRLAGELKELLRPGTTSRDVLTTAWYLVMLSPVLFVGALHRQVSVPIVASLLVAGALPLLIRSRSPLGAVACSGAVTVVAMVLIGMPNTLPPTACAIALFSFAKRSDRRTTVRVGIAVAVTLTTLALILRPGMDALAENLGLVAWTGLAVAIGDATRSRRELFDSAIERAERAEQTKEDEARRRVTEERMRIARELHDVVAHHITLVNAQAGVAHHLMKTDPSHAYEALERIRDTSRSALDELRATVGLLRASEETSTPREPAPGLGDLAALVEAFQHAGLNVEMSGAGTAAELSLSALTGLTAYRIVQEALTNTHKHAGQLAVARVSVEVAVDAVRIWVDDDGGRGPARSGMGTGHGMIGMQERVKAVGGTFAAGPRAGGGFRVEAELPLLARTGAGSVRPVERAAGAGASGAGASGASASGAGAAAAGAVGTGTGAGAGAAGLAAEAIA
ncbi:sensor histidine kinase [Catenulispora sp. NL8]|uniref:histidine kinase n=1 Tax=Catenulispora pinistramenti TaxID=2705254 RepID=A0ABS5L027_9ACTN|nr:histidine kinase [Catenulispora pinistramenti]MBS2551664.1 sensor histidine kinase [Catenulispora pinistramenti]